MSQEARAPLEVTMEEVAARAGVSRATVSRVLSGSAVVSGRTKERVLKAIQDLGYVPNLAACKLAGRAPSLVGLLLRDPRVPAYGLLHSQLQAATQRAGLQLVTVIPSSGQGAEYEDLGLQRLLGLRVDGIFVATGVVPAHALTPFLSVVPIVSVGRIERHPEIHAVSYDEATHARLLADSVHEHGHRRVAVVVPTEAVSIGENARGRAMVEHLRACGAEAVEVPAPTFGVAGEGSSEVLRLVAERRVSAAMFPTDLRALHFIEAAQSAGLHVPGDVSVTGCDGNLPGLAAVGLSTLRIPVDTVAERAVEVMTSIMSAPQGAVHEQQVGELVPGRTLGRV